MSDEILLTIGDDGKASLYDDTYDITIHCESQEEQDEVKRILENIPHWIPVTERLPKKDGSYLVSGKWWSGKESVGDCEFSVEDGYFQTAWNFDVLAWRELPEPYKGVTDGTD